MSPDLEAARRLTLEAFSRAWQARDADALLALMSDTCVYGASAGPEPGKTYRGPGEVHAGILKMFAFDRVSRSEVSGLFMAGDQAAWEWRYTGRDQHGTEVISHGCDLFRFAGEKIAVKQGFRKIIAP